MNLTEVRTLLARADLTIKSEKRLPNETGTQLRLHNGSIVNVFDSGSCNVQGRNKDVVDSALGRGPGTIAEAPPAPYAGIRKVFVVYGHDETSRTQLEAMLRRWGLEPLILDQLPTEGQTV